MRRIVMKIKSLFVKKPKQKLSWTPQNYNMAKRWALTQPHPFIKNKTLWDFFYDKYETSHTIENINKYLFNEL
jgi:hypothetical protein